MLVAIVISFLATHSVNLVLSCIEMNNEWFDKFYALGNGFYYVLLSDISSLLTVSGEQADNERD